MTIVGQFKRASALVVLSAVIACSNIAEKNETESKQYSLVKPGIIKVNQFRVTTQTHWSQQVAGKSVSWTKDGVLLNEIVFSEITKGQDILGRSDAKVDVFKYQPDMRMIPLVELFVDALSLANFHNVIVHSESPISQNTIRFELSYEKNSNVNYTAQAILFKRGNSLYTIYCAAPSGHIFSTVKAYFNEILESAIVL